MNLTILRSLISRGLTNSPICDIATYVSLITGLIATDIPSVIKHDPKLFDDSLRLLKRIQADRRLPLADNDIGIVCLAATDPDDSMMIRRYYPDVDIILEWLGCHRDAWTILSSWESLNKTVYSSCPRLYRRFVRMVTGLRPIVTPDIAKISSNIDMLLSSGGVNRMVAYIRLVLAWMTYDIRRVSKSVYNDLVACVSSVPTFRITMRFIRYIELVTLTSPRLDTIPTGVNHQVIEIIAWFVFRRDISIQSGRIDSSVGVIDYMHRSLVVQS